MSVRWLTAFLDAPAEVAADSEAFWSTVTGSGLSERRGPHDECATFLPNDGDPYLRAQVLGSGDARIHLDLHVDDVRAEWDRVRKLGAGHVAHENGYIIAHSPAGFEFCLVPHEGETIRPAPVGGPGARSLVDQLCLDIPHAHYEREVAFWADLTGWPRQPTGLPEFAFLQRAPGMPLRLLLQRRHDDDGPTRAHVDLACDDMAGEELRHLGLGATTVSRHDFWIVMRDPAGRKYCLTGRDPDTGRLIFNS